MHAMFSTLILLIVHAQRDGTHKSENIKVRCMGIMAFCAIKKL
jgi:hypothetical protein